MLTSDMIFTAVELVKTLNILRGLLNGATSGFVENLVRYDDNKKIVPARYDDTWAICPGAKLPRVCVCKNGFEV